MISNENSPRSKTNLPPPELLNPILKKLAGEADEYIPGIIGSTEHSDDLVESEAQDKAHLKWGHLIENQLRYVWPGIVIAEIEYIKRQLIKLRKTNGSNELIFHKVSPQENTPIFFEGEVNVSHHFGGVMVDTLGLYLHEMRKTPLLTAEGEIHLAKQMEVRNQILFARRAQLATEWLGKALTPTLADTLENIVSLGKQAQGIIEEWLEEHNLSKKDVPELIEQGNQAEELFNRANLPLVVSIAKVYAYNDHNLKELIQEGNEGLVKAVAKFDYLRGYRFSTNATWWIKQAILRSLPSKNRPSKSVTPLFSLDDPKGEGDATQGDFFEDTKQVLEDDSMHLLLAVAIQSVLASLNTREADILRLRFGLDGYHQQTLDVIGKYLGVSRERIRQLENQGLGKIRKQPLLRQRLVDFAGGEELLADMDNRGLLVPWQHKRGVHK
jgi:RNA polymerase sigma factor (sigma-70 family)